MIDGEMEAAGWVWLGFAVLYLAATGYVVWKNRNL